MKRDCVIITASSGLIGSALARRLEAQYEVICFDREGAPASSGRVRLRELRFDFRQKCPEALRRVREHHCDRIASVIHLAA